MSVWCHQISNDLRVVQSGQQVEGDFDREGSQDLREPQRRLHGNYDVTGSMKQAKGGDSAGSSEQNQWHKCFSRLLFKSLTSILHTLILFHTDTEGCTDLLFITFSSFPHQAF